MTATVRGGVCECEGTYEGDCKCGVCECKGEYEVECDSI